MKKRFVLLLSVLFLVARTMLAQGGCVDSPECPTPVLGLVGAASIAFVTLRSRASRKR
jgi:XrtJ-associated TM-motif-TM protein